MRVPGPKTPHTNATSDCFEGFFPKNIPGDGKNQGLGFYHTTLLGAAGFIGSHTCEQLLKRGDSVVAVDIINDYYDVNTKKQAISDLKILAQHLNVEFIFHKVDFRSKNDFNRILDDSYHPIDKICHLGAQAGVRYSVENIEEVIDVNIMGTVTILEAARRKGIKGHSLTC